MATEEAIRQYFEAIHGGDWESFIADDFVFVNSNLDRVAHGKAAYVEGAGRFFRATTMVELKQLIIAEVMPVRWHAIDCVPPKAISPSAMLPKSSL